MDALRQTVSQLLPELVCLRRELHRHPEIRFQETWTSERIADFLAGFPIEIKRGYAGGTGIVADLTGHQGEGPAVALRADMDALELSEDTGLPYASEIPNRMHACGHDGHMASLCGAAAALATHRDLFRGKVRFIFQPGEELGAGGRLMIEEGALDGIDAVFGFHAWPYLPVGAIGVKEGPMMASADWFRIIVHGRGCHGADPAAGVDPILVAAHITTALQSIVSREIDPRESAVVTVGLIQGGFTTNIIPDNAEIKGTIRALSEEVRNTAIRAVERIAVATAAAFRATAAVEFGADSYIPLTNDPAMTEVARTAVKDTFGPDALVEIDQPSMASEDFAYYLKEVPGSYLRLGIRAQGAEIVPLHSARFDFNDDALASGVLLFATLALHTLR